MLTTQSNPQPKKYQNVTVKFDALGVRIVGASLEPGSTKSGAAGFVKAGIITNNLVEAGFKKDAFGNETGEIRFGVQFRDTDEPWKAGKISVIDENGEVKSFFGSAYKSGEYSGIRLDEIPPIPEGELVFDDAEASTEATTI